MSDWFEEALQLYHQGMGYKRIAKELDKEIITVSNRFAKWKKKNGIAPGTREKKEAIETVDLTSKKLINDIEKGITLEQLAQKYKLSNRVVEAMVEDIKETGYLVEKENDRYIIKKTAIATEQYFTEDWEGNQIIKFGVTSDNHLGSKQQQLTQLNILYDIFEREGIKMVYNVGDLTEGFKMRPGHEHEIFLHGADEQSNYVIEKYPKRKGMKTKFILGNHDLSHVKNGGHDIGKTIAKARDDMEYLGMLNAKVYLTPNCLMELNHPLDGASYALSYSIQKMIDSYSGGEKPNILLNGHHHKLFYLLYRNVHGFEVGTTQAQTSFMKGKRIAAHMGGWIVTVHVDDQGTIKRCIGEMIPFYDVLKNDY